MVRGTARGQAIGGGGPRARPPCFTVQGDVSKSADVTRFVDETHRGLGGVDILINNAGVFPRSPFLKLTEAEWDHVLDVNLKGSFLVAQAVARKMVADGTKGAIVNISSSSVRGQTLGLLNVRAPLVPLGACPWRRPELLRTDMAAEGYLCVSFVRGDDRGIAVSPLCAAVRPWRHGVR